MWGQRYSFLRQWTKKCHADYIVVVKGKKEHFDWLEQVVFSCSYYAPTITVGLSAFTYKTTTEKSKLVLWMLSKKNLRNKRGMLIRQKTWNCLISSHIVHLKCTEEHKLMIYAVTVYQSVPSYFKFWCLEGPLSVRTWEATVTLFSHTINFIHRWVSRIQETSHFSQEKLFLMCKNTNLYQMSESKENMKSIENIWRKRVFWVVFFFYCS